jgi:nucleoside-diphosphate kinase
MVKQHERTLVLIKPDAVVRNLVGEIITRFEKTGLKIAGMKMVWADEDLANKHYILDEQWARNVFEKTKKTKEAEGQPFPFHDALEYGRMIQGWNASFLREGPVVAIILEGPHAVEIVRKMIGTTEPRQASPGTIRGDYAMIESYTLANDKGRVLRNLAHASDSSETAEREIALWFTKKEVHSYSKEMDKHL